MFKTIKQVNTEDLNRRLLVPRGIPPVADAEQFREVYKDGKAKLRCLLEGIMKKLKGFPIDKDPDYAKSSLCKIYHFALLELIQ